MVKVIILIHSFLNQKQILFYIYLFLSGIILEIIIFFRYSNKASGHEILSVFLMCERVKGEASEWNPYIMSLPEKYTIPLYFCDHTLRTLPKPISSLANSQCDNVKNSFSQLEHLLTKLQTDLPVFKDALEYELYKWAWSSVNTRCIFMECLDSCSGVQCTYHLALAPFLDLLNHSVAVQVKY